MKKDCLIFNFVFGQNIEVNPIYFLSDKYSSAKCGISYKKKLRMKLIDIMQNILQLMFLKSSGTKQQTKQKNYKKNQTD